MKPQLSRQYNKQKCLMHKQGPYASQSLMLSPHLRGTFVFTAKGQTGHYTTAGNWVPFDNKE